MVRVTSGSWFAQDWSLKVPLPGISLSPGQSGMSAHSLAGTLITATVFLEMAPLVQRSWIKGALARRGQIKTILEVEVGKLV